MKRTYKAPTSRRLDFLGLSLLFLALLVLTIISRRTPDAPVGLLMALPLWLFMFGGSLGYLVLTLNSIEIGEDAVTVRATAFSTRIVDSEVQMFLVGAGRTSGFAEIRLKSGRRIWFRPWSFQEMDELVAALEARYADAREKAVINAIQSRRAFRQTGAFWAAAVFGLFLLAGGYLAYSKTLPAAALILSLVGFLMEVLAWLSTKRFVRLEPEGVLVNRYGAESRFPWQDITSVRLILRSQRNGTTTEYLALASSESKAMIQVDELPLLRDAVLSKVSEWIVQDERSTIG